MRRASFDNYMRQACQFIGWDASNLSSDEFSRLRDAINDALEWAWLEWWWPSTMRCEKLPLRPEYAAATAYAAGDEVWHRASNSLYVALTSTTGNAPATWSGTEYVTDSAHWFDLYDVESAVGEDYDSATAYAAGDVVSYGGINYACHSASTGNAPTNTTYWCALPDTWKYIPKGQESRPVIGNIRSISDYDPRRNGPAMSSETTEIGDHFEIDTITSANPWVWYQLAVPRLVGGVWDSGAVYEQESLLDAIYGLDAVEPDEPTPGNYDHFWDREDLTFDMALATFDYNEKA